jgi:DNA-binding transcriptional MerR regulator
MDTEKTYGPKTVCRSVGISQRQLGYWTLIGVIKPTKQTHGSKIFNRFTDLDVETLRKVKELTEEGFFVSKAAEKVHKEIVQVDVIPKGDIKTGSPGTGLMQIRNQGLASSLYLDVMLQEEIARIQQCDRPLACMAIQIFFPPQFNFSSEKSRILFQLSNILTSRKEPSDVVSYKREAAFLWLLPNRTLEQARLFSKEIKKRIEDPEWDIQNRKFKLTAFFGFGSHTFKSQKEGGLVAEAEQDLKNQVRGESVVTSIQNGANGPYQNCAIGKNRSARR